MRVLITSTSGAGHLSPLLPIARSLIERGHNIKVAAAENLANTIMKAGLDHVVTAKATAEELAPVTAEMDRLKGDASLEYAMREYFGRLFPLAAMPTIAETVRDWRPDLILRESAEFAGLVQARANDIPHARFAVHASGMETQLIKTTAGTIDTRLGEVKAAPGAMSALCGEPVITAFPASIDAVLDIGGTAEILRVQGPAIKPNPKPDGVDWAPTDGRPLIYATLGSVAGRTEKAQNAYRSVIQSVADLPVHVLLTTGPVMDAGLLGDIPDNVTVKDWVPQADVLPWASAVICHGGSGTFLGGAAAGLPMVVVPLFADQPNNARALDAYGAGVAVFEAVPAAIKAAVEKVLADPTYRDKAGELAAEMAAMATLDDAVSKLEAVAARNV